MPVTYRCPACKGMFAIRVLLCYTPVRRLNMPDPQGVPGWFFEEDQVPEKEAGVAKTSAGARRIIQRDKYVSHPLILAVQAHNAWRKLNNERPIASRSLAEYVGVLMAGLEAGDLCAPLRAARTASHFHVVRAAIRFAADAVEWKRPQFEKHGVTDFSGFYGINVVDLKSRADRKGPKAVQSKKLPLAESEWKEIVAAIHKHMQPPLRDVCLVLVQGDLRANDVLRVTREVASQIATRGMAITIQKGDRQRAWKAEPEARAALSRLLQSTVPWGILCDLVVHPDELEGESDRVRLIRTAYTRIYTAMKDLAREVGLPDFHGTHAFRRTLAMNMVRDRAPDRVIQASLGHANLSTTQIYTGGASPEEVEEYRSGVRLRVFGRGKHEDKP